MGRTGHGRPRHVMGLSDAQDACELFASATVSPFVIINTQIIACQLP